MFSIRGTLDRGESAQIAVYGLDFNHPHFFYTSTHVLITSEKPRRAFDISLMGKLIWGKTTQLSGTDGDW